MMLCSKHGVLLFLPTFVICLHSIVSVVAALSFSNISKWPGLKITTRIRDKISRGSSTTSCQPDTAASAPVSDSELLGDMTETEEQHVVCETPTKKQGIVVKFAASKTLLSPSLPLPPKEHQSINDFFRSPENCNLLFATAATVQEIEDPPEKLWESFRRHNSQRRIEAGLSPVASEDEIISTRIIRLINPPMHVLSLSLHSTTQVGIQLLRGSDDGHGHGNKNERYDHPELQLTLLDNLSYDATGPAPLVSLFYKIMGGRTSRPEDRPIQTIGLTRVMAKPADNGVVFSISARLESTMHIPNLLWNFIPMSKHGMETRGSATFQKAIEKDIKSAMERYCEAYIEYISSSQS